MLSFQSRFEARMTSLETRVDERLNLMQSDMKVLNKTMTTLEIDVALSKGKAAPVRERPRCSGPAIVSYLKNR